MSWALWNSSLFPIVVAATWAGLHVYTFYRVAWALGAGVRLRIGLKILLPVLALLYPLGRFLVDWMDVAADMPLLWPGALYLGFFMLAVTLFLAIDLLVTVPCLALHRLGLIQRKALDAFASTGRIVLPVAVGVALALSAHGTMTVFDGPAVTRIEKVMPGLPIEMDGFRLVQVSDIHAGYLFGVDALDRISEGVGSLDADLVVITGDLIDQPLGGDGTAIRKLASFPSRLGVLATTGNREYGTGGEATVENLRHNGLTVLRQEHRVVTDGIVVAGIDDIDFLDGLSGVPGAIRESLAGVPEGLPVVLLSHKPVKWDVAAHAGVDLMLCGHTHGGQLFPLHFPMRRIYDGFLSGRYEIGEMTLYMNNGTGFFGPPIRLMADPEILLVTLRSPPGTAQP